MSEVEPRLKRKVPCPCADSACKAFGPARTNDQHVKGCTCARHQNGIRRTQGLAAQAKEGKALGVRGVTKFHPGNEELWLSDLRYEVKSGRSECGPLHTFYARTRAQSDAAKRVGDSRPYVAIGVLDDVSLLCLRREDLPEIVYALGAVYGYWADL